jgi:pimeloyl-ACP methyl ester carboxylesterase
VQHIETQVTPQVSPPVTLSVRQHGDRDSSTHVLLVHGFPDDQRMWEPVVAALPADWHAITYDVRGSGRSSRPEQRAAYRTELLVEDLVAVLDATVPAGERVHLVGHDWGSVALWDVVAAETWDPRLEGRLASYTSASGPPLDHLASLGEGWRGRVRMLPQTLHSWYVWLFLLPWLPEQMWAHLQWLVRRTAGRLDPTLALLPWGDDVRRNATRSLNLYRANVVRRLGRPLPWRTSVPVLLVVATRDAWISSVAVSGLKARCRDLTRAEVDEGHWLPRARPEEFAGLVAEFVGSQPAA